VTLIVVLALGAVTAGSAFAVATTTVEPWRTGTTAGGTTVLAGSQAVTARGGAGEFVSSIGTTAFTFKWTEVACVSCTIFNETGGAKGEGKLELKNVSVVIPAACTITSPILTNTLKSDWTYMIGTTAYAQFVQPAGLPIFSFTLTGSPPCPAGTYKVTGSFFGKLTNATGVYATGQELSFSQAIDETAGGSLGLGGRMAALVGSAKFEALGKFFGVE